MKVLLVGAYPPPYGGVQVHLIHLEKFLEQKGHTCFIINMGKNKHLWSSKLVSPKHACQVAYYLFKRKDHVCHLHFGGVLHTRLLFLAVFANLLFYRRCAITLHSGGLSVWGQPRSLLKWVLSKMAFTLCGAIICVNSKIGEYFQQLGVKPEKIYIISPFTFDNEIKSGPLSEPLMLFINEKSPLLCNIGLLEPEYDLELLLRVFRRFLKKKPTAGLIMIGSGSLRGKLENMIAELGLRGKAMLTGDLDHSDTLRVLASSNCYIRTSRYDGDCMSLKEALHLCIPVIATDTGLRPSGTILVGIGDENDLLARLLESVSQPSKRKKIANANESSSMDKIEKILSGFS